MIATVLLAHGVFMQFSFEADLGSEPVVKKYSRIIGTLTKEVEEAHTSEWVMLDEDKSAETTRPDEMVAW